MNGLFSDKRRKGFAVTIAAALSVIILRFSGDILLGNTPLSGTIWYTAALALISLLPPMLFAFAADAPAERKKAPPARTAALSAGALVLCIGLNFLLSVLFPGDAIAVSAENRDIAFFAGGVLCLCILPSVLEELLFRGIIINALSSFDDKWAAVLSAAAFAFVHSGVTAGIYAFLAGIVLGMLRIYSGRLVPVIAVHFCTNLFSFTALLCMGNTVQR